MRIVAIILNVIWFVFLNVIICTNEMFHDWKNTVFIMSIYFTLIITIWSFFLLPNTSFEAILIIKQWAISWLRRKGIEEKIKLQEMEKKQKSS